MNTAQIQRSLVIGFVIGLAGFALYRFSPLLRGVDFALNAESPQISTVPLFTLSGRVARASTLMINGRAVDMSKTNQFKDTVLLLPGFNVITLNATNKFGKESSHTIRVQYEPREKVALGGISPENTRE